jgi:hypothetical protein
MDGDLLAASKICPETASSDCPLQGVGCELESGPRARVPVRCSRALMEQAQHARSDAERDVWPSLRVAKHDDSEVRFGEIDED